MADRGVVFVCPNAACKFAADWGNVFTCLQQLGCVCSLSTQTTNTSSKPGYLIPHFSHQLECCRVHHCQSCTTHTHPIVHAIFQGTTRISSLPPPFTSLSVQTGNVSQVYSDMMCTFDSLTFHPGPLAWTCFLAGPHAHPLLNTPSPSVLFRSI